MVSSGCFTTLDAHLSIPNRISSTVSVFAAFFFCPLLSSSSLKPVLPVVDFVVTVPVADVLLLVLVNSYCCSIF